MLSTSLMSEDDRASRHTDGVEMCDTDAEFELDVEVLVAMRAREAEIAAQQREDEIRRQQKEQQLALQQRYQQLQVDAVSAQQGEQRAAMSDEEVDTPRLLRDVSTTSTASTSLEPPGKGYVTVVDVKIQPHRISPRSSVDVDTPLVDVRLHVFQRFVPHLATAALTIRRVSQSHAQYIKQMEAEDGYSSDTSSEGTEDEADEEQAKPIHLTGDRQIDAAMLRKLIGVASDESDSDNSDDELQAVNSTRTTMHDDDEDDEGISAASPLRTKHELPPTAIPPIPTFTVSSTDQLVYCGTVTALVDTMVIVQCQPGGRALDLGSAVCMEDRTALGRVDEVFGPVSEPMYSIRALEGVEVAKCGLAEGMRMYSVPSLSTYVLPDTTPGTDASNLFDEEVEADLQEFSDDEKESEAKSKKKKDKRGRSNNTSLPQNNNARVLPQEPVNRSPRYRFTPTNGQYSRTSPSAAAPSHNHPPPSYNQQQPNPHFYQQAAHPMYGHPQPPPQHQSSPFVPPAAYGYSPYTPLQRPGYYPPPPPGMPHPSQYGAYPQMGAAGGLGGWQYPQPPHQQAPNNGTAR